MSSTLSAKITIVQLCACQWWHAVMEMEIHPLQPLTNNISVVEECHISLTENNWQPVFCQQRSCFLRNLLTREKANRHYVSVFVGDAVENMFLLSEPAVQYNERVHGIVSFHNVSLRLAVISARLWFAIIIRSQTSPDLCFITRRLGGLLSFFVNPVKLF